MNKKPGFRPRRPMLSPTTEQRRNQHPIALRDSNQPRPVFVVAWPFWSYLVLVATIEALTIVTWPRLGLVLYACLLIVLTLHSGLGKSDNTRKLALALTLVPLIRMLALALPLIEQPGALWYPLIALPLLIAAWIVTRQAALPRQALGLHLRQQVFHIMMMTGGLGVGALQYAIFQPRPLLEPFQVDGVLVLMVVLLLLAGFTEELIFRGLVLSTALPILGRLALVYSATLFAVLHIGYLSLPAVIFAFLIGLLFAQIVHWSGSILGVALVHGTANLTQFLILPYLLQTSDGSSKALFWLTTMGMLTPGLILVILVMMALSLGAVLMVLGYLCTLT